MRAVDELRHLRNGPAPGEAQTGFDIQRISARCSGNASLVLERCREVLTPILEHQEDEVWPSSDFWKASLPSWYVDKCVPEPSSDASEQLLGRWDAMPPEEKWQEGEEAWSLNSFLHWFVPSERYWYWWNAVIEGPDLLTLELEITDWPFPWGALRWLLRASGASCVESDAPVEPG